MSRHFWDENSVLRVAAVDTASGCGETHRTCKNCGLVRITMHPPEGYPWPEFILPGAKHRRVRFAVTPACDLAEVVAIKGDAE